MDSKKRRLRRLQGRRPGQLVICYAIEDRPGQLFWSNDIEETTPAIDLEIIEKWDREKTTIVVLEYCTFPENMTFSDVLEVGA